MHHVLAKVFFLAEEAQGEENDPKIAGDQGSFMDGTGEKKGGQSQKDIRKGEKHGDFWHELVTSGPRVLVK